MGKIIFAPAFRVLDRLGLLAGFALVAALFVTPAALALWSAVPRETLVPLAVAGLLLGLYLLAALHAFMVAGIDGMISVTDRIASGELVTADAAVEGVSRRHEAARLWASILRMNESLARIVTQVRTSAQSIDGGVRTIVEGNRQLSERTQEQAASLEETAAGVEQLASSARQNAENCARASELAGASRQVAAHASERMQEAAATMEEIDASSRRVAEILATVEGIAFQTNILALNAAIEAARAGQQGRGFAVVAGEVRNLAQRSAEAAREIHGLIRRSSSSVEKGRALVDSVGATMGEVVGSVEKVTRVLGEIALASREQSAGVEEINRAVGSVDAATQQNAALVEQAAGSAAAFQRETALLIDVVGRFKTDRGEDRGRVIALVKAGVEHVRKRGVQQACADFMDRQGGFWRGEDYLIVLTMDCTVLCLPPKPQLVGDNHRDFKDASGKLFTLEKIELAKSAGRGWVDYATTNPVTGREEAKSAYIERVGDVVVCCGIYRKEAAAGATMAQPAAYLESSWPQLGRA
jgi:methyl-accepting chemotaxis protein